MMDLELYEERLRLERTRLEALSPRERMVYDLWLTGVKQSEIAFRLNLSPKTINTHKTIVQGKLLCNSDVELVKFGVRHGLVDVYTAQTPMDQKSIFLNMKIPIGPVPDQVLKTVNSSQLTTSEFSECGFFTK